MAFVLAVLGGLVFGSGDQFLGSLNTPGLWTVSLSLLSAPWLLVPFGFGLSQASGRRAALLGLVATYAALLGYFLMIMSPFEGGRSSFDVRELHGLLTSNWHNIAGGTLTGPLFGVLGHLWRQRRSWVSAVLVAGALCLEPLAERVAGNRPPGASVVWPAEAAVGLLLGGCFVASGVMFRRRRGAAPG